MPSKAKPEYHYVIHDDRIYRITDGYRQKALKAVADQKSTQVELDPDKFRMVDLGPIEDWTTLTSAKAEALLNGSSVEEAEIAAVEQTVLEGEPAE